MFTTLLLSFLPAVAIQQTVPAPAAPAQEGPSVHAGDPVPVQTPGPTITEPRSKVDFLVTRTFPGGKERQVLLGCGLRTKTIFAVKVYAFGFYVEPKGAAQALEPWRGKSPKEINEDPKFFQTLLNGNFPKSLRWVMKRSVDGDTIADAFQESLEPRLKKLAATATPEERQRAQQALKEFKSFFSDELAKKQEVLFTWRPGGRLVTAIDGTVKGEVVSRQLCEALFDIYLGDEPISKSAKRNLVNGLQRVREAARAARAAQAAKGGGR